MRGWIAVSLKNIANLPQFQIIQSFSCLFVFCETQIRIDSFPYLKHILLAETYFPPIITAHHVDRPEIR